ncbi:hypothetical protein GB931_17855 [Modestobacter sp. I12A-02628]|uniref:Uncharacterized protein n=1 Tax=Goekera deserti TaxID=2497753 RepID=A0A7K3WFX7_9ACTN|nr:hypothetical protein [Goekera deserti]MPQ99750.1 hypothetical protein [Goekera deserti]NDI46239.1 hypothetical protein [Goekera deserti]NEL54829.1 hypothetical protein [Goekera deserti]
MTTARTRSRPPARTRARLATALLGVLGLGLLLPGPAAAAPAPSGSAVLAADQPAGDDTDGQATDGYAADRVVLVGVPGLRWSDVDAVATPQLWSLAGESSIGALSVRSARSTTCLLDGWASAGAGNRARYPSEEPLLLDPQPSAPLPDDTVGDGDPTGDDPTEDDSADDTGDGATGLGPCGQQEQTARVGLADPAGTVARIAADAGTRRFGAEPGALGETVGCATVVGRSASVAVAARGAGLTVTDEPATDPAGVADQLDAGCPLVLVSLDALVDAGAAPDAPAAGDPAAGDPAAGDPAAVDPAVRAAAVARVDAAVGLVRAALAQLPGSTLLLVQGVSEVDGDEAQLHVSMVSGPGFGTGWLTSASTGRAPFVQLIDTAPTVLRALGETAPASMNGQPVRTAGARPDLATAVRQLDLANTAAMVHHSTVGGFFWSLVAVAALLVLAGSLVLGGFSGRPGVAAGSRARRWLRPACLLAASLPIATYLANALPWERSGSPRLALVGAVLAVTVLLAVVAARGPWRRRRLGPPVAVLAVTLGTLLGDALTGSHLELDGLLGYDAIVAGRFVGFGNLSSGLLSVSGLLLTAAVATALGRRAGSRTAAADRWVIGTVAVLGLAVVAVVGAPFWGRDFGGVLSGLPGFVLLAMLLGHVRVTVARLVLVAGVGVLGVSVVALLDWLRPAESRTAIGRFVDQLIEGRAWTVVSRKAQANVDILLGSALAWMLPVCLVTAVWLLYRPGSLRGGPGGLLRSRPGHAPGGLPPADLAVLRTGLLAVAFTLVIGAAVNDSGVALPATAATLLLPLLVWLAAAPPVAPGPAEPADGQRPAHAPSAAA